MKSKIITTEVGHVVFRADRSRPYQIAAGGRLRSYASLDAAIVSAKASQADASELAKIIQEAKNKWQTA